MAPAAGQHALSFIGYSAMPQPLSQPAAPLTPELAFVVQLQMPSSQRPEDLAGRIEHIASGQVARFSGLAELCAFMGMTVSTGS